MDKIKILRKLGFAPYRLGWYKDALCEIVSYPYLILGEEMIQIRTRINDPTSMISVPCFEIETADTFSDHVFKSHFVLSKFLIAVSKYVRP